MSTSKVVLVRQMNVDFMSTRLDSEFMAHCVFSRHGECKRHLYNSGGNNGGTHYSRMSLQLKVREFQAQMRFENCVNA